MIWLGRRFLIGFLRLFRVAQLFVAQAGVVVDVALLRAVVTALAVVGGIDQTGLEPSQRLFSVARFQRLLAHQRVQPAVMTGQLALAALVDVEALAQQQLSGLFVLLVLGVEDDLV